MSLTWSDLCGIPLSGNWSTASTAAGCTIDTASTDGVENGNVEIVNLKNLNISNGANFVWNDGKAITIRQGAHIFINTGAKLVQGYLYVPDHDEDWFSLPLGLVQQIYLVGTSTPTSSYKRRSIIINETDCCDENKYAQPYSNLYSSGSFTNAVNTSSPVFNYDWNCDNNVVVYDRDQKQCASIATITPGLHRILSACNGDDMGDCCGGGGTVRGPWYTQARGYQSRFIKQAQAEDLPDCCTTLGRYIVGCTTSIVDTSSSACGQTRYMASWRIYYKKIDECTGTTANYYAVTERAVRCR
jgi:hypothetical protein